MKIKLTILFVFFLNIAISQNYKFGKISKEELQEQFYPQDSSASAAYLYKDRKTHYQYTDEGFQLITEVHERIKIYNKDGFNFATQKINLYKTKAAKETLTNLKAYTYNLVSDKIEETKLKKEGIFETELSKYYNQKKFTMPNIKEGTVIEYKYKIESPFYQNVDEYIFQHSIPIKKLEARFESPEYFAFKLNTKGFLKINREQNSKTEKITVKSKSLPQFGGRIDEYNDNIEYRSNIDIYEMENIPALKDESYVDNINNYRSAIKYELSYVKFPNTTIKYFSTSWEDVIKSIYKNQSFGGELDKSNYYEEDINELIAGIDDPIKKASLIFNYVKTQVKWNQYYGKYTSKGVKKAYKERVGNVAEINLMLTSMLRYASLNANPVLVSTRNNGIPLFPTREGYNYVICAIELPNNVILLDATSKYSTANILPTRVLNWQGRIIREHGSSALINLYPKKKSTQTISLSTTLNDEGVLEGNIRNVYTANKAMSYRNYYINSNSESYLEKLENRYDGIEISDFSTKNELDLSKPVMESYKFLAYDQAEIIGDNIYIEPLFFLSRKENPFKLEKREFPIDFVFPSKKVYRISIKTPEGYEVQTLPEPQRLSLPDKLGTFKYNISTNENTIQINITEEINESRVSAQYYQSIKEFYAQMLSKENEKIVLIKKK